MTSTRLKGQTLPICLKCFRFRDFKLFPRETCATSYSNPAVWRSGCNLLDFVGTNRLAPMGGRLPAPNQGCLGRCQIADAGGPSRWPPDGQWRFDRTGGESLPISRTLDTGRLHEPWASQRVLGAPRSEFGALVHRCCLEGMRGSGRSRFGRCITVVRALSHQPANDPIAKEWRHGTPVDLAFLEMLLFGII